LDPAPSNAADFALILMLGSLDVSEVDYLTSWVALASKVDSAQERASSSGLVGLIVGELTEGSEDVPKLQFKVRGN